MKGYAMLVSDGENHRVLYLLDKVERVNGVKVNKTEITHKTIKGSATRENAEANMSMLKGVPYTSTGGVPSPDTITVIGVWGSEPALPAGKSK